MSRERISNSLKNAAVMNRSLLDDVMDTLKDLFTPRDKKLVPVRVPANNGKRPPAK